MHIVNCEHPQVVYNRYLRRTVQVSCGKCVACRETRMRKWRARLQQERQCWKYCFEIYLDYSDEYLPSYDISTSGDYLVERQSRFYCSAVKDETLRVPVADLLTDDEHSNDYITERVNTHYTAFAHCSVRDIQLFKKRLTKYIYAKLGIYRTFRYAIASEYGPTTFRPHYHGVLFFNDERLSAEIDGLVCKAWQDGSGHSLGHAYAKPDRGGTTSYVTKYITRLTDLPSCYSHSAVRPFFLTSRNPPIGSLLQSGEEIRSLFFDANPQRVGTVIRQGRVTPCAFPVGETLENRLFPKCPLYGEISVTLRTELYKSAFGWLGFVSDFDEYVHLITTRISRWYKAGDCSPNWQFPTSIGDCVPSQFANLIGAVTHDFESVEALRPLHRILCRIFFQSQIFGISFDQYINQIYLYYDRKELVKLRAFYRFQHEYLLDKRNPSSDVLSMYQFATEPLAYTETRDYMAFVKDVYLSHSESVKTLKKNDYFDSLKEKDNALYRLTYNYYYGKECNETIEALCQPRP